MSLVEIALILIGVHVVLTSVILTFLLNRTGDAWSMAHKALKEISRHKETSLTYLITKVVDNQTVLLGVRNNYDKALEMLGDYVKENADEVCQYSIIPVAHNQEVGDL